MVSAPTGTDGFVRPSKDGVLVELLNATPSDVTVVRGAFSRDKTVLVRGGREDEVLGRLKPLL